MSTEARTPRLLTITDLAERWSCDETTVLEHVRCDRLPFIPVGKRPSNASQPGPKSYRFRMADVELWESNRRMEWGQEPEKPAEPPVVAQKAHAAIGVPGWDGKPRGGRRTKARA